MGNSHKSSVLPLNRGEKRLQDQADDIRKELVDKIDKLNDRLSQLEENYSKVNLDNGAGDLREELVEGIRLIGKRVTKAVSQMNKRFDDFTEEINQNIPAEPPTKAPVVKETEAEETKEKAKEFDDSNFGNIKDGNVQNYELISKTNISKLAQLFRKQSDSIKKIIEIQQQKFSDYDNMLKSNQEEAEKFQKQIDLKMKKNFYISMAGIGFLLIIIILMLIF